MVLFYAFMIMICNEPVFTNMFERKALAQLKVTTPKGKQFRLFNLPYYYAGQINEVLQKKI